MEILTIYLGLVVCTFVLVTFYILIKSNDLQEVVVISLLNVFLIPFYIVNRVLKTQVRKKIKRDFGPDAPVNYVYYWAYGVPKDYANVGNWYAMIRVIFGKADLGYIKDQKWKVSFEVQGDEFKAEDKNEYNNKYGKGDCL